MVMHAQDTMVTKATNEHDILYAVNNAVASV